MPHFFISYAKKDTRDLAEALAKALNALEGVTAWADPSTKPGEDWNLRIQAEIDRCNTMIVLYSPDINRHKQGREKSYVLTEIAYALYTAKKPIIPVMVQKTDPPIDLTTTQYIDFTLDGMTLNDLTQAIGRATGLAIHMAPAKPSPKLKSVADEKVEEIPVSVNLRRRKLKEEVDSSAADPKSHTAWTSLLRKSLIPQKYSLPEFSPKVRPRLDDLIGKTLGQYTILGEIGRGGMATVYRARQRSIDRIVAIKVLPRHFLHDPGFFERFEREVKVITELEHPHILPIYDYGKAEGVPYIVMRYLAGGSMAQMVRRGVGSLDQIERPLSQVAQALDYTHNMGVIHRDLKPSNIILDEKGNAYLSDFGIARVMGDDLTGSAIIGTPAYMSPEQANGLPIDGRSDIYALGVVLFELITGHEPYQAETPMALLLKHINEPMPLARTYRDDVPPAVEDVIAKATAKELDDRFGSAMDMARAFSTALRSR